MRPQGVPIRWHIVLLIIGLAAPVEGYERMLNQRHLLTDNVGLVRANERGIIRHLRGGAQKAVQHPGTAVAQKSEAGTTILQRLTVLVVGVALFNDFMLITMLVPIIPQLLKSPPPLGVERNSEVAMGILFASKDICQLAFAPLAGMLTTHGSSHTALIWSTVGLAISTVAFAEASTFGQLIFARCCQGAASAATMSGGMSLIAETHPAAIRGTAIGLAYSGLAIGVLCGPLLGGILFHWVGRRRTFRLAALTVAVNAIAQVALKRFAETRPTPTPSGLRSKFGNLGSPSAPPSRATASLITLLRNHEVLAVAASSVAVNSVVALLEPLSQILLDREFGLGVVARSLVFSSATVAYLVTTPFAGHLSDTLPKSRLVCVGLCLMVLSSVVLTLRSFGLGAVLVCCCLIGTGCAFANAAGQALLADLVDRHKLGGYGMAFALSDMADSLGFILGPIIGLAVSQKFGASAGVGVLGASCLLLAPSVLRIGV